jgi:hypothetical protein
MLETTETQRKRTIDAILDTCKVKAAEIKSTSNLRAYAHFTEQLVCVNYRIR